MIDYFALALSHALLLVALLRLARRTDLDAEAGSDTVPEEAPADEPSLRARRRAGKKRSDA